MECYCVKLCQAAPIAYSLYYYLGHNEGLRHAVGFFCKQKI
jgi:hypothetical protein